MTLHHKSTEALLIKTGALTKGHFKLSSGRHADQYIQCAQLLQYPEYAKEIGRQIALLFKESDAETIVAPAVGGILVAHEVAAHMTIRAIFTERVDGKMTLRRGFQIKNGEKVIVVEDVITTGKSTLEVVNLVLENGGCVTGIAAIANRSSGNLPLPVQPKALISLDIPNWDPAECPLCGQNIPLTAPGSRFMKG